MADAQDDKEDDTKDDCEIRRARAPSKKKFDEEMETVNTSIRKVEEQLEALKNAGPSNFAEALKSLKAEKNANIERRKKIDVDLQKLNKDITEMMHNISRLESTLHYRSEDRIDEAVRRLEWSLKVQNFRLLQEKKIVAEIDSLRRSKKTLIQYLSMKKDKDGMRDRQRRMREERDYYFHKVTQLKQREEKLKSDHTGQRVKSEQLKKELDRLYETKRQMVSTYKKQREDFYDDREKRRHESFKKRKEEKQAMQAAWQQEMDEYESQTQPYDDDICLCNTLIHYLHRFISNTDLESSAPALLVSPPSLPSPSDDSLPTVSGPAEELEDGQYVLLRRSEDDNYVSCSVRHATRKQRRSRKQSMVKKITHTPEVLAQFLQLNLSAPTTVSEILASLEQLAARKLYYEREAEVKSEAELSVTESAQCEVSRQASHTESNDGLCDSRPADQVIEQLLLLSVSSDQSNSLTDDPATCENNSENSAFCDNSYSLTNTVGSVSSSSTHSRTKSDGSDSTPRSSSTVEGACGGVEESVCGVLRESFPLDNLVPASTNCDSSHDNVFYAKKAQAGGSWNSLPDNCSDLASNDSSQGSSFERDHLACAHNQRHICGGKGGAQGLEMPSKDNVDSRRLSTNMTLPEASSMTSLDEFPALVRLGDAGSSSDLRSRDSLFLPGKKTSLVESTRL